MTDAVHTINQYCDGPELGVADFAGHPHVYERLTELHNGQPEIYRLSPIDPEDLEAVLEDWQLYRKWEAAQDEQSRSSPDDGPRVLPSDLHRHLELKPLVEAALQVDESRAVKVTGRFFDRETNVEWTLV